jgi:hypothetical protein
MGTKREVLRANLNEWLATKPYSNERKELTKHLAGALKIHPRSVGRAMVREQMRDSGNVKGAGRPKKYGPNVDAAVRLLFDHMGQPCAENMKPEISTYIHWLKIENKWSCGEHVEDLVRQMSMGTLKSRISSFRKKDHTLRGYSSTTQSTLHMLIPIRKSHTWVGLPPGHAQMDTVVHCGDLLTSDVIYSVGSVDFATYWSEYTAQWNKGEIVTLQSIQTLIERFPFPLVEAHPDTGTEFINFVVYCAMQSLGIDMTRSEPYKKNDNMCIEERNNTIPRRYVGYARLDDSDLVPLVSEILKVACTIHNHFRPVRRMTDKKRIGAKWHRTYEKVSKTPYQRVLDSEGVNDTLKQTLRVQHDILNPLELKRKLDTLREQLHKKLLQK